MGEINLEMRTKGRQLCCDYLGGAWTKLSSADNDDDFLMEAICGGMSNKLYVCSLSDKVPTVSGEPRKVILRMYGLILSDFSSIIKDSVLVALLAERGLGPRVYGVFNVGRIEEYIESYTLETQDLHQPHISTAIAKTMASFHGLQLPVSKTPTWLYKSMDGYMEQALSDAPFPQNRPEMKKQLEKIKTYDLRAELEFLREVLDEVDSPVVFSHNDLQEGNVLLSPAKYGHSEDLRNNAQGSFQLTAIDFEYASYNNRGFDFANHFCEWCFNYAAKEYPYFTVRMEDFPSVEQQLMFFRAYLSARSEQVDGLDLEAEAEHMLLETDAYVMASHMLWALWALLSVKISEIEFGYMDYALARFDGYFNHKEKFLKDRTNRKTMKEI